MLFRDWVVGLRRRLYVAFSVSPSPSKSSRRRANERLGAVQALEGRLQLSDNPIVSIGNGGGCDEGTIADNFGVSVSFHRSKIQSR